jgi:peptide/nickel transport system permease protein
MSYLVVSMILAATRAIPGEIFLSSLGLSLRPPAISTGVLLKEAQNIRALASNPRLLLVGTFIVRVLSMSYMSDGLRDPAAPLKLSSRPRGVLRKAIVRGSLN